MTTIMMCVLAFIGGCLCTLGITALLRMAAEQVKFC
jgi:hypothetical protein